ncbi:MAG: Primosomal protein [Candidatus Uhrbacteria bacterium GW2011_GWA2_41_10]|nr:MAG: Primosomal protein [Candidatus Uhrbacteria bacterium GW2011_GWA2_41_10]
MPEGLVAEVYPVLRLPRRFFVFDYTIPQEMNLQRGQMVRIPFRDKTILGVVRSVGSKRGNPERLKSVLERVKEWIFDDVEMDFFEWLALETAQSVSAILHVAIPPLPKRIPSLSTNISEGKSLRVRASESEEISRALEKMRTYRECFIHAKDRVQMAAMVVAYAYMHPHDQLAIFVPNVWDATCLLPYLTFAGVTLLTGEESPSHRLAAIQSFRKKETRIFLATRAGSLLLPACVDAIFVLRSSHESYKQSDRNPRYDARETIRFFASHRACRLFFLDVMPRTEDMVTFGPDRLCISTHALPEMIELNREKNVSPHPRLSYTIFQKITDVLESGKRIFCVYNRKGKARALRCEDCKKEFPCPQCGGVFTVYETTIQCHHCGCIEPIPLSCPGCGGSHLIERGFGNRSLQEAFQKAFPGITVSLLEQNHLEDLEAHILLATNVYTESILNSFTPPTDIGCVILLDADLPLHESSAQSLEQAIRMIEELRGVAFRLRADFLMQTHVREFFQTYYQNPLSFFQKELTLRNTYRQPPICRPMRIMRRGGDVRQSRFELEHIREQLEGYHPIDVLFSFFHSRTTQACPILSFSVEQTYVPDLLVFLRTLPDHFIIDTNRNL